MDQSPNKCTQGNATQKAWCQFYTSKSKLIEWMKRSYELRGHVNNYNINFLTRYPRPLWYFLPCFRFWTLVNIYQTQSNRVDIKSQPPRLANLLSIHKLSHELHLPDWRAGPGASPTRIFRMLVRKWDGQHFGIWDPPGTTFYLVYIRHTKRISQMGRVPATAIAESESCAHNYLQYKL